MTNKNLRQVEGTPEVYTQGTTEKIVYLFNFKKIIARVGGTPSNPTCKVYDMSTGQDVSSTFLVGDPASIENDYFVQCTPLVNLQKEVLYRLVAGLNLGGQEFTSYKDILGEL